MRDRDRLAMVPVSLSGGVEPGARRHQRGRQLGCVTPEALGPPHRRVISLDTDGGLLFNLGSA
jgi:sulfopyruvate decarboxylase subunit beta